MQDRVNIKIIAMTTVVMFWFFSFVFLLCAVAHAKTQNSGANGAAVSNAANNVGMNVFNTFDEFNIKESKAEVFDPLISYNRFMTKFNDKAYFWFFKPVARAYSEVTPQLVRVSVSRFFKNLAWPIRVVNNLLQLKFKRAGIETARFAVNTTMGIAGFTDPARAWLHLSPCPEDFGQTLGLYGVGPGIPIVLPFIGPSNVRDAIGLVPDHFLDPVTYLDDWEAAIAIRTYSRLNTVSLHIGEYERLKEGAVDWYIFLRNAYEQNREQAIGE